MPLNQPVRSGQGTGRTVIYPTRSNAELKLAGEESGGDWATVEWRLRAGDESLHTHTGRMKPSMPSTMPSPPTSGISRSRSRRNPTPH